MELEHKADMLVPERRQFISIQRVYSHIIHTHRTGIRPVQGTQDMQEGAFARARWAYDGHHFPLADLYVHSFQDLYRPIPFMNIFPGYHAAKCSIIKSNIIKSNPLAKP